MKFIFSVGIALVTLGFLPAYASANAIGVAPSQISIDLFQGETFHQSFVLSRSNTEGEIVFDILPSDPTMLDFGDQTQVVIPAGENSKKVDFTVDAIDAEPGDYPLRVQFLLGSAAGSGEGEGNQLSIQYGVTPKVDVSVIPRPDPSVILSAVDYPFIVSDVRVAAIDTSQMFTEEGKDIVISWTLANSGENPISDITADVAVMQNDITIFQDKVSIDGSIPTEGTIEQSTVYQLSALSPGGKYEVVVKIGDQELRRSMFVWQYQAYWSAIILGLAAVVLAVLSIMFYKTRNMKRRRSVRSH